MRLPILIAAACLLASPAFAKAERYEFDKAHTRILFFINHMGYSDMVGEFTAFDGTLTFDEKDAATSSLDVRLKPSSVRTSSEALDKKLQGADFFASEQFPEIRFTSKTIRATGPKTGEVQGEVTLRGVTKPVVLNVTLNKSDFNQFAGAYVAGFSADATLKRSDFGMNAYVPMVGDEVRIHIETEAANQDRKEQEKPKH